MVQYSSQVVTFKDGAKNPLQGTSMKFLILAVNAQLAAFIGRKKLGAIHNGMWAMTLSSGDLKVTFQDKPIIVFYSITQY